MGPQLFLSRGEMCPAPLVYGSGMRKLSTMDDFGLSGSDLEQMYQEVILEASKDPHGRAHFAQDITSAQSENDDNSGVPGKTAASAVLTASHEYCVPAQSHQFNPTCGDEVTVRIELSDGSDGKPVRIESLSWDGQGCSISQASLSIMYDLVRGKTLEEAMELDAVFHELMDSRGKGLDDERKNNLLEDAVVFQGTSQYPMRIKCALLGWEGLKDSAASALARISTISSGKGSGSSPQQAARSMSGSGDAE